MSTKKTKVAQLPLPKHYDPQNATNADYSVRDITLLQTCAEAWRKTHKIHPVNDDAKNVQMLIIDDQVDFSFPTGSLYVAGRSGTGAMDAHQRLVEFLYRYLDLISGITCTMDTHLPYQIFYPSAHLLPDGSHPQPNTVISAKDYRDGKYEPNPAMAAQIGLSVLDLRRQFIHYCEQLEKTGKYMLYLWPYHCMLGSPGHRLAGVVDEVRLFHSFARGAANIPAIKGGNPLTEHYSIFSPEVTTLWDGRPIPQAQKNERLIKTLFEADVVIMAGLASSHCVKESIADFLKEIKAQDESLVKKVYILEDCTAAVVIPSGPDFTDDANKALKEFENAGMHVVRSTDLIESWPEIRL
ncbi:MAG: nicotinamidase [Candidatus Paceibacterota bacterium]|jgi:nicotinamidase-related amidase